VTTVFGIPVAVILGQLMLGLVNGSFYAMLSLGLAVIFGLGTSTRGVQHSFTSWIFVDETAI
jgi:hypothetical protein